MGYKILKDKIFHIPTERIKEAERDIKEDDAKQKKNCFNV